MCNRFRSIYDWGDVPHPFDTCSRLNFEFNPNVAPTELVPVILAHANGLPTTILARFGINPTGKDGKPRPPLLNARTDGMRKGQFRSHLKAQHCIIPAAGFYEWREEEGRQPYYFSRTDGKPLMLAGIWDESDYKGDRRVSFAILTDEPNALIAPYHDRMPLALADDKVGVWLNLAKDNPLGDDLLLNLDAFAVRPVNRAVNNARQKDLAEIDAAPAPSTGSLFAAG